MYYPNRNIMISSFNLLFVYLVGTWYMILLVMVHDFVGVAKPWNTNLADCIINAVLNLEKLFLFPIMFVIVGRRHCLELLISNSVDHFLHICMNN